MDVPSFGLEPRVALLPGAKSFGTGLGGMTIRLEKNDLTSIRLL
jgi:hypothetical protein